MREVSDAQVADIPGWFEDYDVDLFRVLLEHSAREGGDLAELGAYLGKSAVLIGSSLQAGERFTVIDLFGTDTTDGANLAENDDQYRGLSRRAFEDHYRAVHHDLPDVVVGPSSTITRHARHGTHRFVHVDAGHLYNNVVEDIEAARILLGQTGVVVFDDYRSDHTPGVSAAVWRASASGLTPFALTPVKMYATFGSSQEWVDVVRNWVIGSRWEHEVQSIGGHDVVRLWWEPLAAAPRATSDVGLVRRAARRVRRLGS